MALAQHYTVDEVADRIQLSVNYIYRLARTGKIPCTRIGRHVRFSERDLEVWLDSHRVGGEASPHFFRRIG
jgi:excisionase family DNA binding protein